MTTPQRLTAIAIVVAALGGVAIWLIAGGADAPERASDRSTPSAIPDAVGIAPGASRPTPGAASVAESKPASITSARFEETAEERLAVTGRTIDFDDAPLGRIEVRLQVFDGYEAKGDPLVERSTKSGADGAFLFSLGRPVSTVTLVATVVDDDFQSTKSTETVVRGDPDPQPFVIRAGRLNAEVTGTVSSKAGARIANATVGWGRTVPTDDAGTYRYRFFARKTGQIRLSAKAAGYAKKDVQLAQPKPGSTTRVDFTLAPEAVVTGHVLKRDGAPIAGAKVWSWASDRVEILTDASGSFRLAGFDPEGEHQWVRAEAEGFVSEQSSTLVFVEREAKVGLVLEPGVEVRGVVVGRDEKTVEGAEVRVGKPSYIGTVTVRTDAEGRFRLPALKPGPQEIAANRRGYAETTATVQVPDAGGEVPELRIRLEEGRRIGGIVTDPAGAPLPGIWIAVQLDGAYSNMSTASTNAEGRFTIDALPAAKVSLEFYARGWLRAEFPIREYRDDLKFVLERAGGLAGRVLDARSHAPLNRFTIRIVPPDSKPGDKVGYGYSTSWFDAGREFVDTNGFWTVDGEDLQPGSIYGIEASAAGYAAARAPRVVATPSPAPDAVVLELSAPGSVAGTAVVEATGSPVADATISVLTAEEETARSTHAGWKPKVTAKSDASGNFVATGAPAGTVHLLAEHPEYPLVRIGPLDLHEGERLEGIVVKFSQGASIEGTCLGLDGRPAVGASVSMQLSLSMGKSKTSVSDEAGRFSFRGLGAGPHYLSVRYRADAIDSVTQVVLVAASEKKSVVVPTQGTGRLEVEVESDEPVPSGLLLSLIPELPDRVVPGQDQRPWRYRLMSGKSIELAGIAAGAYRLTIQEMARNAGLRGEVSVEISDGQKAEVRVPLRRAK